MLSKEKHLYKFKKRYVSLDWRRLGSVDIQEIETKGDGDPTELRNITEMISFCKISQDEFADLSPRESFKLFRLAQMIIECLIYDKEEDSNECRKMRKHVGDVKALRSQLSSKAHDLAIFRKKYKKMQQILGLYEYLLKNKDIRQPGEGISYYVYSHYEFASLRLTTSKQKCDICLKIFSGREFLKDHLQRRHIPEDVIEDDLDAVLDKSLLYESLPREEEVNMDAVKGIIDLERNNVASIRKDISLDLVREKEKLKMREETVIARERQIEALAKAQEEKLEAERDSLREEIESMKEEISGQEGIKHNEIVSKLSEEVQEMAATVTEEITKAIHDEISMISKEEEKKEKERINAKQIELFSDTESEGDETRDTTPISHPTKEFSDPADHSAQTKANLEARLVEMERKSIEKDLDEFSLKGYSYHLPHMEEVKSIYQHGKTEFKKQREIVNYNVENTIKKAGVSDRMNEADFHASIQKVIGNRILGKNEARTRKEELLTELDSISEKYKRLHNPSIPLSKDSMTFSSPKISVSKDSKENHDSNNIVDVEDMKETPKHNFRELKAVKMEFEEDLGEISEDDDDSDDSPIEENEDEGKLKTSDGTEELLVSDLEDSRMSIGDDGSVTNGSDISNLLGGVESANEITFENEIMKLLESEENPIQTAEEELESTFDLLPDGKGEISIESTQEQRDYLRKIAYEAQQSNLTRQVA